LVHVVPPLLDRNTPRTLSAVLLAMSEQMA
jgi:hypothetical protein